jgi:hypothetical protein
VTAAVIHVPFFEIRVFTAEYRDFSTGSESDIPGCKFNDIVHVYDIGAAAFVKTRFFFEQFE